MAWSGVVAHETKRADESSQVATEIDYQARASRIPPSARSTTGKSLSVDAWKKNAVFTYPIPGLISF